MPNKATLIEQVGGSEVLKTRAIPDPEAPKAGQVVVRHTAIGVNYIDAYYRSGLYKLKQMPFIPGVEAVGIVEAVGANVSIAVGTRVCYGLAQSGAYCQRRTIEAKKLVPVPNYISDEVAAACLHKGMVAHMLLFRVYKLHRKDTVLIHDATDGTGTLLCQWARHIGAKVIGTVSSPEKISEAQRNGCHHAVSYKGEGAVKLVREVTKGEGVTVVYDSVGKDTYVSSLQSLMPLGFYANYDQSSGAIPGINILSLSAKGIFLTRPNVFLYKGNTIEMALTVNEIFEMVRKGILIPKVGQLYALEDVGSAHDEMVRKNITGSLVIKL